MEKLQNILGASLFWRLLMSISNWFGVQWQRSAVITAFLTPNEERDLATCESSVFFRLFQWVRKGITALYNFLKLDKLFEGSVFTHPAPWAILTVAIAPLLPTMALLGLALLCLCSVALSLVRDIDRPLAHSPMNRYIFIYCFLYAVGTLFSVSPRTSLNMGLVTVVFVVSAVVLQNAITTRRALDTLVGFVVVGATVVALIGIYQYIFRAGYQSAAWIDSDMFSGITFRVPSTLDNPNMLGQFFLLTIPLGGACLLRAKTWGMRFFYLVCCGLMCITMILTFSRGAWLGLLFAGAIFFLFLNPKLIWLAPFALIVLYFVLPETVIARFTSIGDMGDNSTSYRVYIWMGVIEMLKDYWLWGIGPGDVAFNMVYPLYSYSGIVAPHTHNLFLQIITDVGICALVIFCVILFQYFRTLCAAIRRKDSWDSRILQIACTASVVGFMVQSMTDYAFYNYRVMFCFWAVLAIGALSARRESLPAGGTHD